MFRIMYSINSTDPAVANMSLWRSGRIQIVSGDTPVATIWMDPDGSVQVKQEWQSVPYAKAGEDTPEFSYQPRELDEGDVQELLIAALDHYTLDGVVRDGYVILDTDYDSDHNPVLYIRDTETGDTYNVNVNISQITTTREEG